MANDTTTTVDSLDASLNDLLKAARATQTVDSIIKSEGLQIEGGVGDDFAGTSDAGKLDDMMIAKMTAAGFSPAQAKAMVGFMGEMINHDRPSPTGKGKMKGKQMAFGDDEGGEEPEEEPEEQEEPEEEEAPAKRKGKLAKSFHEQFVEDSDIANALDVSPFIEALTLRTTEALDSIQKSVRKGRSDQDRVNKAMAIALVQVGTLCKSQAHVINELGKRIGIVERTPNAQKGATSGAQALHKSMPGEAGPGAGDLRKGELVSTLSYMNLEKGIREIGGEKMSDIIVKAEAGNIVPPSVLAAAQTFLRTHPMEADTAKRYA